MKKIIYLLFIIISVTSCTKDFDELNTDTKNPANVEPAFLFCSSQRQFADFLTNPNVNFNIWRLIMQQWTQTTYTDESNYDLVTRNIPRRNWGVLYADVLKQVNEAQKLVDGQNDKLFPAAVKANQKACCEILSVNAYYNLVTLFGPIPYSEALTDTNYPKYDLEKDIFEDLLKRLNQAITSIKKDDVGFENDLFFHGDMKAWSKYGNSLKLKVALTLADINPKLSKAEASSTAGNLINSNAENVTFAFEGSSPNTNPLWTELVQSGRQDFVGGNSYVNKLKSLNDPRIGVYFTKDNTGDYSGGVIGESNNYQTLSKPGSRLVIQSLETIILDYSEVEFLVAEAIERGYSSFSGSAEEHYNNAISASIEYWTGSTDGVNTYLNHPDVTYTSSKQWAEKIGTQKWLALYNRGFESWIEWRRLDFPNLEKAADAVSEIPLRFNYSDEEATLNRVNYENAIQLLSEKKDNVTSKLYWDTH